MKPTFFFLFFHFFNLPLLFQTETTSSGLRLQLAGDRISPAGFSFQSRGPFVGLSLVLVFTYTTREKGLESDLQRDKSVELNMPTVT